MENNDETLDKNFNFQEILSPQSAPPPRLTGWTACWASQNRESSLQTSRRRTTPGWSGGTGTTSRSTAGSFSNKKKRYEPSVLDKEMMLILMLMLMLMLTMLMLMLMLMMLMLMMLTMLMLSDLLVAPHGPELA